MEIIMKKTSKNNYLPSELVQETIKQRLAFLKNILDVIAEKERILGKVNSDESIRIILHRNGFQYFLRSKEHPGSGKYIRKKDLFVAKKILQSQYHDCLVKQIEEEISMLNEYLLSFSEDYLFAKFNQLPLSKKEMVTPIIMSDEEYVKNWLSAEYEGNKFPFSDDSLVTDKGETVRSKSELIIANTLNKMKIPYRYEFPVKLSLNETVYPDFFCLNIRLRKEIIWEHLGLMDDEHYARKNVSKIERYNRAGYFQGDNLICTMETSESTLNTKILIQTINKFLL